MTNLCHHWLQVILMMTQSFGICTTSTDEELGVTEKDEYETKKEKLDSDQKATDETASL